LPRDGVPVAASCEGEALAGAHLERAIGVIYEAQTERRNHYFPARLPKQFDYLLHFDENARGGAARADLALGGGRDAHRAADESR